MAPVHAKNMKEKSVEDVSIYKWKQSESPKKESDNNKVTNQSKKALSFDNYRSRP